METTSIAAPLYVCCIKEEYNKIMKGGEGIPECFKKYQHKEEILIILLFQLIYTIRNFLDSSTEIIEWINLWFYTDYPFCLIEKTQK